jgi:hypothetical protein
MNRAPVPIRNFPYRAKMSNVPRNAMYLCAGCAAAIGLSVYVGRNVLTSWSARRNRGDSFSSVEPCKKKEGDGFQSEELQILYRTLTENGKLDPSTEFKVVLGEEYHKLGLRHAVFSSGISPAYLDKLLPLIMVKQSQAPPSLARK